jgi:7-cyano-7-deazaguanine tRNA-ribosyltransferase
MARLPFDLYALGSPVEFLENYDFPVVTQMILAAKGQLPIDRPLHLFGAGHPLILPLAVALGCDLFDSASYLLYARDGRYMTPWGTEHLAALSVLPCSCRVCSRYTAQELGHLPDPERKTELARHNLAVLAAELRMISHAIESGRMWELVGMKARAHPRLWAVYRTLHQHVDYFEDGTPVLKPRALFLSCPEDLGRPEVSRHFARLRDLGNDGGARTLVLMQHHPERVVLLGQRIKKLVGAAAERYAWLSAAFGIIPLELADLYPLAQHVSSASDAPRPGPETIRSVGQFVRAQKFRRIIALDVEEQPSGFFDALAGHLKLTLVRDTRKLRGHMRRIAVLLQQQSRA